MHQVKITININLINKLSTNNCIMLQSTYHLFLSPHGQILAEAIIYTIDEHNIYLLSNNINEVMTFIDKYKFRDKIELDQIEQVYYHSIKNLEAFSIKDPRHKQLGYWSKIYNNDNQFLLDKAKYCILELNKEVPYKAFPFLYNLYVNLEKGCFIGQESCQYLQRIGKKKFSFTSTINPSIEDIIIFKHDQYHIVKRTQNE